MSRSLIGSAWLYQQDATLPSIPAPSRDITAGSVVVYRWRYEGGGPALSSFSDGTAATWTTLEYGTNPTVGYAVCLNHPGGTGTVGTVNLSSSRGFGYVYGVELAGGSAAIDAAPGGVTGADPTLSYTSTGDGTGFAVTGYYSGSGITPTSPAALEISAHAYSGYWKLNHTGAGAKSMATTGGSGNTVSLAVVIKDAAAAPVITGPSGAAGAASISITVSESQATVGTWSVANSTGTTTLGGTDAALLSIDNTTKVVTKAAGNFSVAAKPTYDFTVVDGASSQAVALAIASVSTTARPSSDVTVVGWTASAGGSLFDMVDEVSASDTDYITSPTLSPSTAPATFGLQYPLATGSWTLGVRARTTAGAGTLLLELLDAAGSVVGTSATQALTSTFTTYSLSITTTGVAERARITITNP